MDLHRTTGQPDWENISANKRTTIQRIAFATNGIITPPNVITIIGLVIVLFGIFALLTGDYWTGLIALTVGRLLDIVDGVIAQRTGTKSPLGELLDASVDKVGTVLTIIAFYVTGISWWWLITLLLLPQIFITIVSFYKRAQKKKIHPTRTGKLSMATLWASLVGLLLVKALELPVLDPVAIIVYLLSAISIALGWYALTKYISGRD